MPEIIEKKAVAIPDVGGGEVATISTPQLDLSAAAHDMSMVAMFMEADIVVKLVMILLLLASFWSWTIIFDKLWRFKRTNRRMQKFEREIWSADSLEKYYKSIKDTPSSPTARVFVSGMYEWLRSNTKKRRKAPIDEEDSAEKNNYQLKVGIKERVFHAMDITRNREISLLEKNLSFLATVGSTAPFIGLFGTVWGIMNSFQSIAATKNTTLAVVAPGIAEALFATAVGLFAAIPAVIFYNKFASNVANFSDRLDEFSDEFGAVVARELDG